MSDTKLHPVFVGFGMILLGYTPIILFIGLALSGFEETMFLFESGPGTIFALFVLGLLQSGLIGCAWVIVLGIPLHILRKKANLNATNIILLSIGMSVLVAFTISTILAFYYYEVTVGAWVFVLVYSLAALLTGALGGLGMCLSPNNGFNSDAGKARAG